MTDLFRQLDEYGDFLQSHMHRRTNEPTTKPRPDREFGSTGDENSEPNSSTTRSWRPGRYVLVAAMLLIVAATGAALYALQPRTPVLAAEPVLDASLIERRPEDPSPFVDRLNEVDYQLTVSPSRQLSSGELADVADFFEAHGGDGTMSPELVTATATFEFAENWIVVDADMNLVPLDPVVAGGAGSKQRCRVLARTDGEAVSFDALGYSCWDVDAVVLPGEGEQALISYGCRPAIELGGLVAYGRGDFVSEITVPPGSPGAIFTLLTGETVLVRPVDQELFYAGPEVDHVDVYYADGHVDRFSTSECG